MTESLLDKISEVALWMQFLDVMDCIMRFFSQYGRLLNENCHL